jgi:hypothetical protein
MPAVGTSLVGGSLAGRPSSSTVALISRGNRYGSRARVPLSLRTRSSRSGIPTLPVLFRSRAPDTRQWLLLNGKKLANDHSAGLVAMNAVAGLASDTPYARDFLEELWLTPVPRGLYRYYDGLLCMLALLQVSGNFKVYGENP